MNRKVLQVDSDSSHGLQSIAAALSLAQKVVVVIGAGVSTAANIPDFRSGTGLYGKGEIFSSDALRHPEQRAGLLSVALELRQRALRAEPTATHRFIRTLRDKGQLLRCYTQNIDMLEVKAGLRTDIDPKADCVPLHGSLGTLRCQICRAAFDWDDHIASIHSEEDLPCPQCLLSRQKRIRKSLRPTSIGYLLPDIALLGADHSNGEAIAEIIESDLTASPDMLLVLGTSLRVSGPRKLASTFARVVRKANGTVIYMNLSKPHPPSWARMVDYVIEDACDTWVEDLETRAMNRIMVGSRVKEGEDRGRGSRHQGRGRKDGTRIEVARGKMKEDGSAEYPFIVD